MKQTSNSFIHFLRSRYAFLLLLPVAILSLVSCSRKMSESVHNEQAGFNGSFEYAENGMPANWLLYTARTTGSGDFDMVLDTIDPKDGAQSFKYVVRSCEAKGGRFSPGMAQEAVVEPGIKYRVSFWVKNEGTEYTVRLSAVNAFGAEQGPVHQSSESNGQWTQYTYDYTIPASMNKLRFELNVLKPGVLWVDGVSIEKI